MTKIFRRMHTILIEIELTARVLSRLNVLFFPNTRGPLVKDCSDGLLRLLTRRGRRGPCHLALLPFVLNQKTAWLTSTNSVNAFFLNSKSLMYRCAVFNWTNILHYRMSQHRIFFRWERVLFLSHGQLIDANDLVLDLVLEKKL